MYAAFLDRLFGEVFEERDSVTFYKRGVVPGQLYTLAHWASLMIQMPKVASTSRNVLLMWATSIPSERAFARAKRLADGYRVESVDSNQSSNRQKIYSTIMPSSRSS